jgi:hypothetical protein
VRQPRGKCHASRPLPASLLAGARTGRLLLKNGLPHIKQDTAMKQPARPVMVERAVHQVSSASLGERAAGPSIGVRLVRPLQIGATT